MGEHRSVEGVTLNEGQALALAWRLLAEKLRETPHYEWEAVPMLSEDSMRLLDDAAEHVAAQIAEKADFEDSFWRCDSVDLLAAAEG